MALIERPIRPTHGYYSWRTIVGTSVNARPPFAQPALDRARRQQPAGSVELGDDGPFEVPVQARGRRVVAEVISEDRQR
jgi:hypothetical protein